MDSQSVSLHFVSAGVLSTISSVHLPAGLTWWMSAERPTDWMNEWTDGWRLKSRFPQAPRVAVVESLSLSLSLASSIDRPTHCWQRVPGSQPAKQVGRRRPRPLLFASNRTRTEWRALEAPPVTHFGVLRHCDLSSASERIAVSCRARDVRLLC